MTSIENREPARIAKLVWADPQTAKTHEYILHQGASATIGLDDDNVISIKERHVARRHAVLTCRDGAFMLADLGSSNGTFVNDQRLRGATTLKSGDTIRLYVPLLLFSTTVSEADQHRAEEAGTVIRPLAPVAGNASLLITNGLHEGETINLLLDKVAIGRATSDAAWEIGLQDPTVSRPHARLERDGDAWLLRDLGSSNGTQLNGRTLDDRPQRLHSGDVIGVGTTVALFRLT